MIYHHLHPFKLNHLHNAECVKCLGKGTFGDVKLYRCKDKCSNDCSVVDCNSYFVVKQLHKIGNDNEKKIRKKLLNEYTIGSLLHHENIRETLDVDLQDNSIIFEYFPGLDFFNFITCNKPDLKDCLFYYKQLIDGVCYMHDRGIAHMDLKLENIMIDFTNKKVKIIDFGQSKVFHDTLHINSIIFEKGLYGSLPCIAPEEFNIDKEYNPEKVDVWACGIILYEIIYNKIPWKEATENDTRYNYYLKCLNLNRIDMILPNTIFKNSLLKMLEPNPEKRCFLNNVQQTFSQTLTF